MTFICQLIILNKTFESITTNNLGPYRESEHETHARKLRCHCQLIDLSKNHPRTHRH